MNPEPHTSGHCRSGQDVASGRLRSTTSPGAFHARCAGVWPSRSGGVVRCSCDCHAAMTAADENEILNHHQQKEEQQAMSTTKTKTKEPRTRQSVVFVIDGKRTDDRARRYTLGYVAQDHTTGIEEGVRAITTARLREILAANGIADPDTTPGWKVTLPNGKVLEAVEPRTATPEPEQAKAEPEQAPDAKDDPAPEAKKAPARKAPAKKAAPAAKRTVTPRPKAKQTQAATA